MVINNQWIRRSNAGGCRNVCLLKSNSKLLVQLDLPEVNYVFHLILCSQFIETFPTNPQYRIVVTDPDEQDADNTGTLHLQCALIDPELY